MSSCMMVAKCVGVRSYVKKDNTPAYVLTVAMDNGSIIELFGNGSIHSYPFGTDLTVGFDLNVFNGKVNGLRVETVKEYKV